jgi:hypothetical protein
MTNDDRDAAEDYRRQRQEARSAKTGVKPRTAKEQTAWLDENQALLIAIAKSSVPSDGDAVAVIEEYREALSRTSGGSDFDDIQARQILERVIREIESVCKTLHIPVRSGVVYGVDPEFGLRLGQTSVLMTEASIIDATVSFLAFCNLITKILAISLPKRVTSDGNLFIDHAPQLVRALLQHHPELVEEWTRIIATYAEHGAAPPGVHLISDFGTQALRTLLIRAVEIFALAHEYGHHVLKHQATDTSEHKSRTFNMEHEADIFARVISVFVGRNEEPQNPYAMYGTGAVIILSALELVRKAKAILQSGSDDTEPLRSHPSLADRIAKIAPLDDLLPIEQRQAAAQQRYCFMTVFVITWEFVRPSIVRLHADGVRPNERGSDIEGWLPISP